MRAYLTISAALCSVVKAHMEMTFPLPLESKYDKLNTNPDYTMTAPLAGDGSNFPCKGYLSRPDRHTTAAFTAGQTANFTLTGTATHGGGSCQISLSYDGGKTFKVINSILGGCPLQDTYNFQFPKDLPNGNQVIFSWSWMNKLGNREFYQNCALVDIQGSGSSSYLNTLPDMQVANVGTGCTTIETIEVIPLNPGSFVQYGGSYSAGASAVNGNFGAGLSGSCGTASSSPVTGGNVNTPAQSSVASPATTTKAVVVATSSIAPVASGICQEGAILCTGTGYTWSLCNNGKEISMGAVAPGTICRNGAILLDTGGNTPAQTVQTPTSKASTQSTTSTKAAARPAVVTQLKAVPTSSCLSRRGLEVCEEFSMRCDPSSESRYQVCTNGVWGSPQNLSVGELCLDDVIFQSIYESAQLGLRSIGQQCSGTGISCLNDGKTYQVCEDRNIHKSPTGTRCVDGGNGGGFITWHS